jgi:tRNA threonylcarbamoyladenosine biosynthesis protein TsaB
MKILSADTAAKTCSVAVMADDTLVGELTVHHQSTHARFLMAMVNELLRISGLALSDIDGFAVTTGPGSFTGLRIGISTFKGFALAAEKPIVGVSSLDALVYPFLSASLPICAMLDARKGEVYTARYRFRDTLECLLIPSVLAPEKAVAGICEPFLFVGEGAVLYREVILKAIGRNAVFARPDQHLIRAAAVAALGMRRFKKNDVDDAAGLVPFYIRTSDAERKLRGGRP